MNEKYFLQYMSITVYEYEHYSEVQVLEIRHVRTPTY